MERPFAALNSVFDCRAVWLGEPSRNWCLGPSTCPGRLQESQGRAYHPEIVLKLYKPKFHLARHVTTRHDSTRSTCRAHAMHFGCVEVVEQHGSTHLTRRARLAGHVRHDERDRRDSQFSFFV